MNTALLIRPASPADAAAWEHMRNELWPADAGDHAGEIAAYFAGPQPMLNHVLLAFDAAGEAIGFAELSIRAYAPDCYSGRVAFLEGWFVESRARRRGVGAALVSAAEEWGRAQGCTEFASDTETTNVASAEAHIALGFTEVESIVCFRKDL